VDLESLTWVSVVLIAVAGLWFVTAPQRNYFARNKDFLDVSRANATRLMKYHEVSQANAIRQCDLLERIAVALEHKRAPEKTN